MIHARLYSFRKTGEAYRDKAFSTTPEDRPLIAQVCPFELLTDLVLRE